MKLNGRTFWLGRDVDYTLAWDFQNQIASQRFDKLIPNALFFLEHSPVYTVGRRFSEKHLLNTLDAPLIHTDRGGQITYHGPGQLICYPIILLSETGLGPKLFVAALQFAIIDYLENIGIEAWTEKDMTGVWTSKGKVAAIGIKISRGVTTHGFALNINPDLSAFESIVPCGIEGRSVTSVEKLIGKTLETGNVCDFITTSLGIRLGIDWSDRSVTTIDKF